MIAHVHATVKHEGVPVHAHHQARPTHLLTGTCSSRQHRAGQAQQMANAFTYQEVACIQNSVQQATSRLRAEPGAELSCAVLVLAGPYLVSAHA
jgi:hypothetical protein